LTVDSGDVVPAVMVIGEAAGMTLMAVGSDGDPLVAKFSTNDGFP
jgi:hypothetical protein